MELEEPELPDCPDEEVVDGESLGEPALDSTAGIAAAAAAAAGRFETERSQPAAIAAARRLRTIGRPMSSQRCADGTSIRTFKT